MPARLNRMRLVLGLALGLAFFGCVGLPRRRPPTEDASRTPPRQRQQERAAAPLRIPAEPKPAPAEQPPPGPDTRTTQFPPSAPPPAADQTPPEPMLALRQLYEETVKHHDAVDSYIVRLTRRETLRGKKQPEELLLFKFRKQPKSVYMKWLGPVAQGREVIWVDGQHESKIHTLLAAGDMLLAPAGQRISLATDSMFVRNSSRHSITEAGIGTLLDRFGQLLAAADRGDTSQGMVSYLGKVKRAEFAQPIEGVEWTIPPGVEPSLPRGGKRWCFVDPESRLPALILTHDEHGQEVEYYRYDRYLLKVHLDDKDFDPNLVWAKPRK